MPDTVLFALCELSPFILLAILSSVLQELSHFIDWEIEAKRSLKIIQGYIYKVMKLRFFLRW